MAKFLPLQWFLDGKQIYATPTQGNGRNPEEIGRHPFAATVTAGRHVLCVELKPGSKGFQLRADIAFTDQLTELCEHKRVQWTHPSFPRSL